MMDLGKILLRVVFGYILLLVLVRASGHRTVAQATTQGFLVVLVAGDLIDDLVWGEVSPSRFAVAASTLVWLQVVLTGLSARSARARRWLEPAPAIVVRGGSLLHAALRRERVRSEDLERLLRSRRVQRNQMSEVASGWLETNGEFAVVRRTWARAGQKQDYRRMAPQTRR